MFRVVLLGLLAVSATSSCKGGSDTAQVAPGAAAGRVLQASGKVAATRDGKTRTLVVGDDVFGDDVIETASDGSLVIELTHNHARWSVEGSQRARIDESVAWRLAKQDRPATPIDHATSAAGRDGERTAADTRSTTDRAPPEAVPAPASDRAPEADQEAAPGSMGGKGSKGASRHDTPASTSTGPVPVAPSPSPSPSPRPPPPPPPPPEPQREVMDPGPRDTRGAGGGSRVRDAASGSPPADATERARELVEARRGELTRCLDAGIARLTIVVRVANGKPAFELAGGKPSERVRACIAGVVARLELPQIDTQVSIELAR